MSSDKKEGMIRESKKKEMEEGELRGSEEGDGGMERRK